MYVLCIHSFLRFIVVPADRLRRNMLLASKQMLGPGSCVDACIPMLSPSSETTYMTGWFGILFAMGIEDWNGLINATTAVLHNKCSTQHPLLLRYSRLDRSIIHMCLILQGNEKKKSKRLCSIIPCLLFMFVVSMYVYLSVT